MFDFGFLDFADPAGLPEQLRHFLSDSHQVFVHSTCVHITRANQSGVEPLPKHLLKLPLVFRVLLEDPLERRADKVAHRVARHVGCRYRTDRPHPR